jgi:glycosyltransferase involved in cell wall biosynthesis
LFLSNLIVSKGVLQLLDACQLLAEKNLEFECDFVGAETDEMTSDRFSQEVKNRGLEGRVHYLGKKYGEEKESIWDDADIFVFPTFYPNECFPLVLLEAMQHGLPCVSTEEGAISGIIEDGITGFIVEKKNHEQLANRIEQLLSDANLRHSMGVAGRQKFEEEYTLSVFEKRMSDIFLQIFSERK